MHRLKIVVAAAFLAVPAPLLAQTSADELSRSAESGEQDNNQGGNPRLGLLGLLGLGGLFGLFRREPAIHVDARRDKN